MSVARRRLVLASASPARARLLEMAGLAFDVRVSGVDEEVGIEHLLPDELVLELARRKARAVAAEEPDALVLGCDSMFHFHGAVYGKPSSPAEAAERWRRMRGNRGVLLTGHCLIDARAGEEAAEVDQTVVHFGSPTDAEIDAYAKTDEAVSVAGGFTLDGLTSPFVDSVEGNPGTVIGVSLPLVRALLSRLGVEVTSLWR